MFKINGNVYDYHISIYFYINRCVGYIYIYIFVAKLISISMRNGKYSIGIGFIDVDKLLNILSIDLIIGQMYIPCFKHVSSHRTVNG